MIVIGLTGPTGAGKGVCGRFLQERGALIVDTDRLARDVVAPGSETLSQLAAEFGQDILREDGSLNRAALAQKAFADPASQRRLNTVTHPAIIRRSQQLLDAFDGELAVIDAPLLFESGMDRLCDTTLAILAPDDIRLARITARDGISEEQARLRMNAQPDAAFYRERATHTITNDADEASLYQALDRWLTTVKEGCT